MCNMVNTNIYSINVLNTRVIKNIFYCKLQHLFFSIATMKRIKNYKGLCIMRDTKVKFNYQHLLLLHPYNDLQDFVLNLKKIISLKTIFLINCYFT